MSRIVQAVALGHAARQNLVARAQPGVGRHHHKVIAGNGSRRAATAAKWNAVSVAESMSRLAGGRTREQAACNLPSVVFVRAEAALGRLALAGGHAANRREVSGRGMGGMSKAHPTRRRPALRSGGHPQSPRSRQGGQRRCAGRAGHLGCEGEGAAAQSFALAPHSHCHDSLQSASASAARSRDSTQQ